MNTVAQIVDVKWFTQLKNGDNFDLITSDFSQNIIGSIFENVKLEATVRTFTTIPINKMYVTSTSLYTEGASFTKDISIGDTVRIYFNGEPTENFVVKITSVSDEIIYFNTITPPSIITLPGNFDTGDFLVLESDLTYLRYDHGLSGSTSGDVEYSSKLDGETTSFFCEGIGLRSTPTSPRSTAVVNGVKSAINSNAGSFKVNFVGAAKIPTGVSPNTNSAQDFKIEHIFKIQDYSENDIQNYIDRIKPEVYVGESTLNYNSRFEFRTVETDPSSSKIGQYISKGNIGFFGENINGRPNKYSISNLSITRALNGDVLDDIASGEASKVTFTINGEGAPFNIQPKIVLQHFAMLTDYQFKDVNFNSLFKNDTLRLDGVSTGVSSVITEGKILSYTNNTINVEMTVNPNDSDLDGEEYFLSVLVGDASKPNNNPDKVQQIIKTGTYASNFDIEGLIGSASIKLFQRDCDPYTELGNSSMSLISGELIYTKLSLPVLGGEIDSIEIQTLDFDGTNFQVVDSEEVDTSSFKVINGEQEINQVLLTPYSSGLDGIVRKVSTGNYEVIYPYRLPFDKLIPVEGLSDSLFDSNEPNDGFNESTFYQQSKGMKIHIAYKIGMRSQGYVTYYRYKTPILNILNFETTL